MRAPIRSLALTATVIAALATAGCKSGESAAPAADPAASSPAEPATSAPASPSSSPSAASPSRTTPALAGPGDHCGTVVLPNSATPHRVVVTKGRVSCAAAMSTIKRYYVGVSKGRGGGNTATLEVGPFVCQSPTAVTSQQLKAATVCENQASHAAFKVRL
jgi:hypothetical protein